MHTHTLLIADDSITIQRVIQLTFANEPIRVLVAADGQQALDCIEAERPDIVLACTDVPGVDGYAIARYVSGKRHLRKLPVLLLTNRFEPSDELRVKESGAKGVVEKPLEPGTLMTSVKHALGISTPDAELVPAAPARKKRRPSAQAQPARARSVSPKSRKAKTRRASPVLGPGITHEALAQIVGGAVAHAVVHAIDAYERTIGLSPEPAIGLAAPLPKRSEETPVQSNPLPPQPPRVSLERLRSEMGFDDFFLDDAPPRPAAKPEPVAHYVAAVGGTNDALMDEGLSWLASELRADRVQSDAPSETRVMEWSSDATFVFQRVHPAVALVRTVWDKRPRIAISGAALAVLPSLATSFFERLRGADVLLRRALRHRRARRYRSAFDGPHRRVPERAAVRA